MHFWSLINLNSFLRPHIFSFQFCDKIIFLIASSYYSIYSVHSFELALYCPHTSLLLMYLNVYLYAYYNLIYHCTPTVKASHGAAWLFVLADHHLVSPICFALLVLLISHTLSLFPHAPQA